VALAFSAYALAADPPPTGGPKSAGSSDSPPTDQEVRSAESDGVRLTVSVPRLVPAGSPVPVQVKLANHGGTPIMVEWATQDPFKVRIALTTKDGKPVPYTRYGKKVFEPTDLEDVSATLGRLLPRQFVERREGEHGHVGEEPGPVLTTSLFPGRYALTVTKSITLGRGRRRRKRSSRLGPIRFTVTDP